MNRLPIEKRAQILGCLTEGMSLRATARLADVSLNTITKLLVDVGAACEIFQLTTLVKLPCKKVQCDEIWSFVGKKESNVLPNRKGTFGQGDVYTWVAIDAGTKLVVSWLVGRRSPEYAKVFMDDLASRLANRVQLTTDGHRAYLVAVENAFHGEVDYAMLKKLYSNTDKKYGEAEHRYSPGHCIGSVKGAVSGDPKTEDVSTSYVER